MRLFRKLPLLLVCVALGVGTMAAKKDGKDADKKGEKSGDKKKDKDKDKKGDAKKGDAPGATPAAGADGTQTDAPGRLSLPLVEKHPSFGLKIPYIDVEGRLQMSFTIGVANKIDPDHVQMSDLQVETYNEEGESEMTVDLPVSVLDLNTRVITSNTKTTIRREDFTITGDSVAFDTVTRAGKLIGNVHMTVYNVDAGPTPEPNPAFQPAEDLPQ